MALVVDRVAQINAELDAFDILMRDRPEFAQAVADMAPQPEPRRAPGPLDLALSGGAPESSWPLPEPFEAPAPPPFDPSWLPGLYGDYAAALAESLQVAPDLPALVMLGAVSVATLGRFTVQAGPDWVEPTQLFVCVALPPSEKKSPVFSRLFAPVREWEANENDRRAVDVQRSAARRKMMEKQLDRAANKGDAAEVERLAAELAADVPVRPVTLLIDDATPEVAARLAAENGGCLAAASAEGGLLDILAGRYADGRANLDLYLQGYSSEPVTVHRIGREPIRIPRACIDVTLAVQPAVVRAAFENPAMSGRGLLARFLWAKPRPLSGHRRVTDLPEIPPRLIAGYRDALLALLGAPRPEQPTPLRLDAQAADVFNQWREAIELRRREDLAPLESWGWSGKLDGLTLRLAATIHLMDGGAGPINAQQVRRAVSIAGWAVEHARAVSFGTAGAGDCDAQQVLAYIKGKGWREFAARDLYRNLSGRKAFRRSAAVDAALQDLARAGYVRPALLGAEDARTGRQAARWSVNPYIFAAEPDPPQAEVVEL